MYCRQDNLETHLDSSVLDGKRASNFSGTTTVHNPVVSHQVADDAQSIV